ncbi:OmpA family protein [Pedobacter duraquae]|uniref:OmpA family protein n=1 Tax=Pedobacter duraquae TaxID=425511 RepID=A0A4R6IF21_9SPHI|nr:OmpA family protein [Pedobacter duraquae]TDO20227.1 OmpA family protein [Pedobacter duraquae]
MNHATKKTNNRLTSLLYTGVLATCLTACSSSGKKGDTPADTTVTTTSATTSTSTAAPSISSETPGTTEVFKDFDWNTVPVSTAEIGAFPYLTAPSGFYIGEKDSYSESKTGYSTVSDFNKLFIFTGSSFYNAEGKVGKLKFRMKGDNVEWNQYKFDSSVEKYLTSIGAKLIGKMKLDDAKKKFLNKDDDMAIHNHMVGDPYNVPVRFYALNHAKGKVMFQVFSNTAEGDVGVVELAGFEQTIKAPTAAQMKKDIDATGKAILNINFDTDKSTLQPEGQKAVDEILALLKNDGSLKLAIEGHTDNAGAAAHNKMLSAARANTILKSLTSRGIATNRLTATGFGAERPLVANDSEANMARNRRVELVKK